MRVLSLFFALLILPTLAAGQRIAILTPLDSPADADLANSLENSMTDHSTKPVERSLAATAFKAANIRDAFNLSTAEARSSAASIGCEFLVILRSEVLRRASFSRPDYYEAFSSVYLVSGRSGRLAHWQLISFEAETERDAIKKLIGSADKLALDLVREMRTNLEAERVERPVPQIEQVPDDYSQAAKDLRAPVPYRRIKPEYNARAAFYNIRATIDALADVSETGQITRVEITRWAGFGLDESVTETIRKMNWKPAMRNGKPLAMRVLLRYNFTKVEDDD